MFISPDRSSWLPPGPQSGAADGLRSCLPRADSDHLLVLNSTRGAAVVPAGASNG